MLNLITVITFVFSDSEIINFSVALTFFILYQTIICRFDLQRGVTFYQMNPNFEIPKLPL